MMYLQQMKSVNENFVGKSERISLGRIRDRMEGDIKMFLKKWIVKV
jgi:hypothetical protein